jgi:tetratricopeptide (TPR) repeat protein
LQLLRIRSSTLIALAALFLFSHSTWGAANRAILEQARDKPIHPPLQDAPEHTPAKNGFNHFYNMEYDAAIRDFELAQQAHPNDPSAVNHLLQAILVHELHREGALDAEMYFGDEFFHARKIPANADTEARIEELIGRALRLSAIRLKSNPNDADALYARGVTEALHATDLALVEKSWFAALRSGLEAYKDHKQVLNLSPGYADAKLVVGFYSYAIGSLPWPGRIATFFLAFTGSKSNGIEYIKQAADAGGDASVDAKAALALILARERHYSEAIPLMHALYTSYPHNFLFAMSEADLLKTDGHLPEAMSAYQKLLELGRAGIFPEGRLERIAFKLGETLRLQGTYANAVEAYRSVSGFPHADHALVSKATLSAGEMYDLLGQRDSAVQQYQEVVAAQGDSPEVRTARQLLKHPYRMQ